MALAVSTGNSDEGSRIRSSEIRRLRREASDCSPHSQSTQYFTPRSSLPERAPSPPLRRSCSRFSGSLRRPRFRSRSVPLKKRRSATASALTRMVSCMTCQRAETPVPAPPRRLRSGEVDLSRFEKTDGQIQEAFIPNVASQETLPPPSSLPISLVQERSLDDAEFRFLRNVERLKRMSGTWSLIKSRSDAFSPMSDLLEFNWVFRKALDNSDIMELRVEGDWLHQSGRVFKLLDIHERLNLRGQEVKLRRRDMRRGALFAKTFLTPTGYINKLHWHEPCAGGLVETMEFSDDAQELTIRMHICRTDGRSCDLTLYWERLK